MYRTFGGDRVVSLKTVDEKWTESLVNLKMIHVYQLLKALLSYFQ